MTERRLHPFISERKFPKEVLSRELILPFEEYLSNVYGCDYTTAKLAQGLVHSLTPLCEISPTSSYAFETITLRDGTSTIRNIVESDPKYSKIALTRGSGPLIYMLGKPKYSDTVPRLWNQFTTSNLFDDPLTSPRTRDVVNKIAPTRDCDVVLELSNSSHGDNISKTLTKNLLETHQLILIEEVPPFIRLNSGRYFDNEARVYKQDRSYVFVGRAKRKTQLGEYRNTIVDFYSDDKLSLRLDIDAIDPHSLLSNNYRIGVNRSHLDFATMADIVTNPEGNLNVIIHPSLLQYFSGFRVFTQFASHDHFTHALTSLLREIDTLIFYAGNFSPEVNMFDQIRYWTTQNPLNSFIDFDHWSYIAGFSSTQEQLRTITLEERAAIDQRQNEITASYLRNMTRNPFLFLAIASGLHLMTHISIGPEHHANYFLPEINIMAKQIAPEINWDEKLTTVDDLWNNLPVLTSLYEERVLNNQRTLLENSGGFTFLKAFYWNLHDLRPVTEESVVDFYSPIHTDGFPRHLFFPLSSRV